MTGVGLPTSDAQSATLGDIDKLKMRATTNELETARASHPPYVRAGRVGVHCLLYRVLGMAVDL